MPMHTRTAEVLKPGLFRIGGHFGGIDTSKVCQPLGGEDHL